ncbi:MAG TPA: patatin-like phospholipase family protein [Hyphomicrobiaceae bacterium]|nr:patatin-like phospholipase family protein [Hyphomicrobiaceae bacterium]
MRLFHRKIKLNLALQGGGAHGAFTWGVLDRLLEEEGLEIGWISATSAGAVNAVALAAGLLDGGRDGARSKLRQVWEAVYKARVPDLLRLNPFFYGLIQSASLSHVTSLWSPYDLNPLGFDPLRTLLSQAIDFAKLKTSSPIEFLIAATEVATGRARLFRRSDLTLQAVLASACLPTLHRAVEIDGVAYWDGAFSANPDLVTLALESPVADTLIVQINPLVKHGLPTGVREIASHVNRLTFNAPLLRDVEIIETVRETMGGLVRPRRGRLRALARHRFHLIEAGRYTGALSDESKMRPDWGLFTYLHGAGRTQTHKWLHANRAAIGRRSSVDLKARFLAHETFAPGTEVVSAVPAADGQGEVLSEAAQR